MKPRSSIRSFDELPLLPEIQAVLSGLGYARPMPVQAVGLPLLLAGESAIVRARTGTGKTALFSLPLLQAVQTGERKKALILAPTRELAHQISAEVCRLSDSCDRIEVGCVIGGRSLNKQAPVLKRSNVVVMTPGRAAAALAAKLLVPEEIDFVVVDEADHMLEEGSIELCSEILQAVVGDDTQLVFCSATFSDKIRELCKQFRPQAQIIEIPASTGDKGEVAEWAINTYPEHHLELCIEIIHKRQARSCITFCNHRQRVDEVAAGLCEAGLKAVPLHGDLDQAERDAAVAKFRQGKATILVATDLGSRGIDIPELELVINYDFPYEATAYVHRYGRTGRAGKGGLVVNFYNGKAVRKIEDVEKRTGRTMQRAEYSAVMRDRRARTAKSRQLAPHNTTPLHIRCGRKDGMTFALLKKILRDDCDLHLKRDVAFLDVQEDFSFIGICNPKAEATCAILKAKSVRGKPLHVEIRNSTKAKPLTGEGRQPARKPSRRESSRSDKRSTGRKPSGRGASTKGRGSSKRGGKDSERDRGSRAERGPATGRRSGGKGRKRR